MNTKGFTLIELLAVIVILAIILLIAMPIVLDVINEARQGAFDSSAQGLVKTAEQEYMRATLDGETDAVTYEWENGEMGEDELDYSGESPDAGELHVTSDGYIALWLTDGTHCAIKDVDETEVTTVVEDDCKDYFESEYDKSFPTP